MVQLNPNGGLDALPGSHAGHRFLCVLYQSSSHGDNIIVRVKSPANLCISPAVITGVSPDKIQSECVETRAPASPKQKAARFYYEHRTLWCAISCPQAYRLTLVYKAKQNANVCVMYLINIELCPAAPIHCNSQRMVLFAFLGISKILSGMKEMDQ